MALTDQRWLLSVCLCATALLLLQRMINFSFSVWRGFFPLFTPRNDKQRPRQYLESTSRAQRRSLFLYRELTTFCQRRKCPVQCESHFKSFPANVPSLLTVLLTSLPPSASPHTPSSSISSSFSSSSADNPMGHSRRTEAVWRCSERGLLQVSTSDSTQQLLQLLEHYLNRIMMEQKKSF